MYIYVHVFMYIIYKYNKIKALLDIINIIMEYQNNIDD